MILCRRCNQEKEESCFRKDDRYKRGYASWCHECHRERNSTWAKENRTRLTKKAEDWRKRNLETARKTNTRFKRKHKDRLAEAHAMWAKNNRDKRNAAMAKRKAAKLMACPWWAEMDAIKAIYKQAKQIQQKTGTRIHVDHIVPLQSDIVCGLHVPANLQIIPASKNESKRNFWWPDMPFIEETYRQPDMFIEQPVKLKQESLL